MVQKHEASHLHYDLRLEYQGVLKSWAVPRGIPLEPSVKRLAIETEDHPMEYRDFEGVIPEPDYGAGTVMVWDRGRYYVDAGASAQENQHQAQEGLSRGRLSFVIEGKKIHGRYSLIRMRKNEAKTQWLLLRHKDSQARPAELSVKTGKTMDEIKAGRTEGGGENSFSSVFRQEDSRWMRQTELPSALTPMLATLVDEPFDKQGWIFELKWDGYRCLTEIRAGKVRLYSRNNKTLNNSFPVLAEAFAHFPADALFDGEIVAVDEKGASRFQLLQNVLDRGQGRLLYYVFDVLYLGKNDLRQMPLLRRKDILRAVLPASPYVKFSDFIEVRGKDFFSVVQKNELEGIIAKKADSPYRSGERSGDWLKIKALRTQEAVIAGFTRPKGSRKFFSSLLLGLYEEGRLRFIGHTGSGFTEDMLKDIHIRLEKQAQSFCPFASPPKTNSPAVWVKPELVCVVRFLEWTKEGLMRQPVFLGLREDISACDVKKEIPRTPEVSPDSKFVFSHPDKVFWPQEGYTKKDVRDYYQDIADFILPYLKDRPQSLNRFPNGIEAESFFQKNVYQVPQGVKTVSLPSESKQKNISAVLCQDRFTLEYLNNLGCIELNVWNSTVQHPDHPDYLVFDLDPVEVPFADVVRVALQVKEFCLRTDIPSYCKTSGGRGIHIYVPLRHGYSYEQAKNFAYVVSSLLHDLLPDMTSLERSPARRKKRVYLDYLQNHYGVTMASPYSLRPRPQAPVSAPLAWEELVLSVNPREFNLKTMRQRLKRKGDVWKGFWENAADLEKSLAMIENIYYGAGVFPGKKIKQKPVNKI